MVGVEGCCRAQAISVCRFDVRHGDSVKVTDENEVMELKARDVEDGGYG